MIGMMFRWERNGFVCLQFLFSCFFITLIVAHADGKRPLQGDWSVLLTRKSTCCAIFYLFLDKIDFWCSNIYLHLFGEQCSCAMYLFWWFLSGFKYLTTRKTFAVLLSLLNSLRIKNGYTCYMGGRIEEKNNSGYACYTGKRIEEKTMATLGELECPCWRGKALVALRGPQTLFCSHLRKHGEDCGAWVEDPQWWENIDFVWRWVVLVIDFK